MGKGDRIVRIASRGFSLGPVRTFLSRRVVSRARHPSNERSNVRSFVRSFVPARLSMGEPTKGYLYRFKTRNITWWGLRVTFYV